MPTYEYECGACGPFEQFQRITDDPLSDCPRCGSAVRRLISSGTGIIFKGSGFYSTDSRNAGKGSSDGDGAGKDGPGGKDGSGKDGSAGNGKDGAKTGADGGAKKRKEPAAASSPAPGPSSKQGTPARD